MQALFTGGCDKRLVRFLTMLTVVWQIFVLFFKNWLILSANRAMRADLTTVPTAIVL
jgi:hypothetical protein